jgi:hypothetical protein
MEETLRDIQKRYASRALYVALAVGAALIVADCKPLGKGLILGAVFSAINFVIIGEMLPWQVGREGRSAAGRHLAAVLLRFGLLTVPLVMAVRQPQFDLWGVVPGLLMVQAVILADHAVRSWQARRGRIQEG